MRRKEAPDLLVVATDPAPIQAIDLTVTSLRHAEADVIEPDSERIALVAVVQVAGLVTVPVSARRASVLPLAGPPLLTCALVLTPVAAGVLPGAPALGLAPVAIAISLAVPVMALTVMAAVGIAFISPPVRPELAVSALRRFMAMSIAVAMAAPAVVVSAGGGRQPECQRRDQCHHAFCAVHHIAPSLSRAEVRPWYAS